ncbi:hypothetical protein RAZWK3B_09466 [Roseobacter sp. AzwK-3b]|uniref:M48 family metallopeptidase n=1 Tax=Roseobacter sp. AzwK-3b TaxID=351016 RepID=UPI0001569CFD|nr:M48 family metallopeptidase [Roseobacter sp. AzwK-3b]EDM72469.1 hypothetical protein RAZWK3B_09466 [Roseobacter sp. AzwK-3b]
MPGVAARYFDGQSAGRHAVELVLDEVGGQLVFDGPTLGDGPHHWPFARLRAQRDQARKGGLTLMLHAATDDEAPRDPARLTVNDPGTISRLRRLCPDLDKRDLHPGTWGRIVRRGALAVAAVGLILFVILPRMADTMADLIPIEREIAFGKAVTAQLEQALGAGREDGLTCDDPAGHAALSRMLTRLTEGRDLQYDLQLRVFDHEMVNAFAAPGGQVVILRGLLDEASGPDAVAAVLAHEIGHVERRDATRHALRAAGSAGILSMVLGDVTGGAFAVFLGEQLIQSSYSREAETRADQFALEMLNAARVDSDGMAEFFDHIGEMEGEGLSLPEYLASHPPSADLAEAARRNADAQGSTMPVLGDQDWQALQAICD